MKMLVVDDHAIVRQALAALLRDRGVAGDVLLAGDLAEGLAVARAHPDLDALLLDLKLPGADGMEAIGAFSQLRPEMPIIILSSSEDPADVRRALDLGALGYVPKSASSETLVSAVNLVLAGGVYVPTLMLNAAEPAPAPQNLTPRQAEVLAAVVAGHSNKQIGRMFGLSEKTVKVHVTAIFRALGVSSRTQAARAFENARASAKE